MVNHMVGEFFSLQAQISWGGGGVLIENIMNRGMGFPTMWYV